MDIAQTTGDEFFFIDTEQGRMLTSEYAGYAITNDNPDAYDDVWVRAYDFSGGVVRLGTHEDGYYRLGRLDPGETDFAWFYLSALAGTADDQSHTITVYEGDPREGGVAIMGATRSFTIDMVQQTIEASSNKIFSVSYDTATPELGGTISMTVTGNIGQAGGDSALFTPASKDAWRADVFELETMTITIESGPNAQTRTDELLFPALSPTSDNPFTAVYTFRVVGTTDSATEASPTQFVGRNTQWKHHRPEGPLPPVPPATNELVLEKLVDGQSAISLPATGPTVTYSLTFENLGPGDAILDSIRDVLPVGAMYQSGSSVFNGMPLADPTIAGETLTWIGPFEVSGAAVSTLAFQASLPAIAGVYVNESTGRVGTIQIDATLDTTDDVPATAVVTCLAVADLSILKTSPEDEVVAGEEVTYSIVVTNGGPNDVTDARVQDDFPATLSDVSWILELPGGSDPVEGSGSIDLLLDLPAFATATFTVTGLLASDAAGVLLNAASVWSATTIDPNPANNTDDEIDAIVSRAVLTLSKDDGESTVVAGDEEEYTYTIRVGNDGPSVARGVVVTDDWPTWFTLVPGSITVSQGEVPVPEMSGDFEWEVGELAAMGEATLTVRYTVPSDAEPGLVVNSVTATSNPTESEPVTAIDETTIVAEVALTLEKDDGTEFYKSGGTTTYTITLDNTGPSFASAIRLVDILPDQVDSGSWTASYFGEGSGGPSAGSGDIDVLVDLAAGGRAIFELTVLISTAARDDLVNKVTAIPREGEGNSVTDTDVNEYDGPINPQRTPNALVVSPDANCFGPPLVRVLDAESGEALYEPFLAYEERFRGSVQVATGDLGTFVGGVAISAEPDGVDEIVVGPGRSRVGEVRVFTQEGIELSQFRFLPFGPKWRGGVEVAVGDFDGDGDADIAAAQQSKKGTVSLFLVDSAAADPVGATAWKSFRGFPPKYANGVTIAAGDFGTCPGGVQVSADPDGRDEVVVGTNSGKKAQVRIYDVSGTPSVVRSFQPIGPKFKGGVTLSVGRFDADEIDDVIVGAGRRGNSVVEVYSGATGSQLARLTAFSSFSKPQARVFAVGLDLDRDGIVDDLFATQGSGGGNGTPGVTRFDGVSTSLLPGSAGIRPPLRLVPIEVRRLG
ncbi:MAG: hypothetical protein ACO35E_10805 [Ilumatobacteraceae bacterium]